MAALNPATASTAVARKRRRDSTVPPPPQPLPLPTPWPASAVAASISAANYNENRRKLSDAIAAVGLNPGDDLVARGNEILANALVAPKTYNQFLAARTTISHPECRRILAAAVAYITDNPGTDIPDDYLGSVKLASVVALFTQAAITTVKVEGYYLHFAKKLFQPLEEAKRFFGVDKDEITETLEITERLQKEKAAPNPDSVSRRKLAVAAAVDAAANAAASRAAEAAFCKAAEAAFVDNPYFLSPEKLAAAATAVQAAFVNKIECYYLELAKKLFEPLEDAKRAFEMEKDEITERFQKEMHEITERFQKEKDEITERLQKEKDAITERLQKEKDKDTESLHKKKDEITERFHKRRKRLL